MLRAFIVYSSLILFSTAVAGAQGYSASSLFTDARHMGPGAHTGGYTHSYYSGHYHK